MKLFSIFKRKEIPERSDIICSLKELRYFLCFLISVCVTGLEYYAWLNNIYMACFYILAIGANIFNLARNEYLLGKLKAVGKLDNIIQLAISEAMFDLKASCDNQLIKNAIDEAFPLRKYH